MKIIISPAKTMRVDTKTFSVKNVPVYREQTEKLLTAVKKMSLEELQKMYKTSEQLTQVNFERFMEMDLNKDLTPALIAYQGQVYQHINVKNLNETEINYLEKHLRIISGFYGLVKPFDGIVPYRLEMSNKLKIDEKKNLYEFWGDTLYQDLFAEDDSVINLASKEYFSVISPYLKENDRFINVEFAKEENGKTKQLGMVSKMARGEMIRYLAENQIEKIEQIKEFKFRNLNFSEKYSTENTMMFIQV